MATQTEMLIELLDAAEAIARKRLLVDRYDSIVPFYHLVAAEGGKDAIIPALWGDQSEKLIVIRMVKRKARELGSIAALFCGEVWMIVRPPGTDETRIDPPSQQPDRIEAVMVIATDGVRTIQRSLEIKRAPPSGKIVDLVRNDPFDVGDGGDTSFSGLLIDDIIVPALAAASRPH